MEKKLYIGGLPENSGPGDLLGAITNQAEVQGNKIGEINVKGSVAEIYVSEEILGSVLENLKEVAGKAVRVASEDDPKIHFLKMAMLVEIEREEEMRRHEKEIKNLTGREREEEGRAILNLKGRDEGTGLGGKYLIKFVRQKQGESLPENEISIGDLVMLSKNDPLRDDNPTGTVAKKSNYSITVAFEADPSGFLYGKGLRCDLYVNDITYQRQLEALLKVFDGSDYRLEELTRKAIGEEDIEFGNIDRDVKFLDENLNGSQKEAVVKSLSAKDFFLIHGPPGTGKTVNCIEVARQVLKRGEDVLCTADSNTAVDNMVEWLAKAGEKVIRVGHPARVTPMLRKHTLDEVVQQNEKYQKSQELREKAMDLVDKQDEFTHPGGRWRRGMSDEMIKSLAQKGKGSRGVPPSKIEEMAKWLELQEKIDELFTEIEKLEEEAVDEILEWADVVCATNSGCGSELMSGREFDTLIIDEATQATEPSCWIPMILSDKVVMAGDHKQLPPTVLSKDAEELNETLFESLMEIHGDDISRILKVQYRMHQNIMNFSNEEFYDGVLKADESVASYTLEDMKSFEYSNDLSNNYRGLLDPEEPVVFLDTRNIGASERQRKGSTSRENPKEADLAASISSKLIKLGMNPDQIAIITPYDDQVDLINRKIGTEDLEVDTVDGFQGREKEAVILSLVRSNPEKEVGFLKDVRRLNVSLTRAKRKLIIIGDGDTVSGHETYRRLIEYVTEAGGLISLPPEIS